MAAEVFRVFGIIDVNGEAVTRVFNEIDKNIDDVKKRFKSLGEIGRKITDFGQKLSLFLTLPIIGAGTAASKMAMDVVESENLFEVSMGEMSNAARQWSEELSKSLGLNQYELRQLVGTFNVMFTSMGFGKDAAYQMSTSLVQLAYDMASFYNLKPEEAFEKLRAGITGETEPLKQLGILIDENTVKTYAYKNGIAQVGQELTEAQKVAARYGAILQQTSKAQGDLARTIDSPANQLRILRSRLEETAVKFGQLFIPVIGKVVSAFNTFVSWLQNTDETTKKVIVAVLAFIAFLGPLTTIVGSLIKGIQTWATVVQTARKLTELWKTSTVAQTEAQKGLNAALALSPMAKVILLISAIITAVSLLYKAWVNNWFGIQEKTRAVGQTLVAIGNGIVVAFAKSFNELKNKIYGLLQGILNALAPVVSIIGRIAPGFEAGFERLRAAVANKIADIQVNIAQLEVSGAQASERLSSAWSNLKTTFSDWSTTTKDAAVAADESSLSLDELLSRYKSLNNEMIPQQELMKKQKDGTEDNREEWEKLNDTLESHIALIKAQQEIAEIALSKTGTEAEKLQQQLNFLNNQYKIQEVIVAQLEKAYQSLLVTKGENSKSTADAAQKYAAEAKNLNDLRQKIEETTIALERQTWVTDSIRVRLEELNAEQDKRLAQLSADSSKIDELNVKNEFLNKKLEVQKELVNSLQREYDVLVKYKGKDAEETRRAYLELIKAQTEQANLKREIRDTNKAIREQQLELDGLSNKVADVARKYREDLVAAQRDYWEKVNEVNKKLIEDERKVTEEYENELKRRAEQLRDFVGLFDEVKLKSVSGEQLLENLRKQVEVFEQWRENIQKLAARGVDEGLIAELREMGPKAAVEIAALNTLSDEQLAEYVNLWRTKNEQARIEAEQELAGLRVEVAQKIQELRSEAAARLAEYAAEWQRKNEEIRNNTIKVLEQMIKDASEKGRLFVVTLAKAIETALPELTNVLQGLPGFKVETTTGNEQVDSAKKQKEGVISETTAQTKGVIAQNDLMKQTVIQTWEEIKANLNQKQVEISILLNTSWTLIQQQLTTLWLKIKNDAIVTWNDIRKHLFDVADTVQKRFEALVASAQTWGISLMSNFISGIWSQFDRLIETLQTMAEIVDSYMPHSPAKRGPLSKLDEYGPSFVKTFAEGILKSLPSLELTIDKMAAVASGVTVTNNYMNAGDKIAYITIQANDTDEILAKLERQLVLMGFNK